jgi:hypothetical protein
MQYYNINHNKNKENNNNNNKGNRNFSKALCLKINTYFGEKNLGLIFCHSDDKVIAIQPWGSHTTSKSFLSFLKRCWKNIKGPLHHLPAYESSDELGPLVLMLTSVFVW